MRPTPEADLLSLRAFHVVFIAASVSLLAFMGFWFLRHGSAALGTASLLLLSGGLAYLRWFLHKRR